MVYGFYIYDLRRTGEKISSFKTYRRWLRDQSAYRRKALHGMKEETEAL
jgi:hypothetical protein